METLLDEERDWQQVPVLRETAAGASSQNASLEYEAFLATKKPVKEGFGIQVAPDDLPSDLFPFQREVVSWALERGRAALFLDCGMGKTACQLVWGQHVFEKTGRPVLIAAPLAVAQQTKREGDKFGVPVTVCRSQSDVQRGVNVTNYEMLDHFSAEVFSGVVIDECFPRGTSVDVVNPRDMSSEKRYIEDMREGDLILNASGVDCVKATCKRRVHGAVRVQCSDSRGFTCSLNHPFLTVHGWRRASDLQPGDKLAGTEAAMRLVRGDLRSEVSRTGNGAFLRKVLLGEMADEHAGAQGQSPHARSRQEARGSKEALVQVGNARGRGATGALAQYAAYSRNNGEDGSYQDGQWNPERLGWDERRQRNRANQTGGVTHRSVRRRLGAIERHDGTGEGIGLSQPLQDRLCQSRTDGCNRARRAFSSAEGSYRTRSSQRGAPDYFRVDSVEVLEPSDTRLDGVRETDGSLCFYDLEATRHPSFSVNGVLVHNSSILKNYMGSTKRKILDMFSETPYRLACTATPAPNDHMELGNQAEFLGVMRSNEMLMRWFINDTMQAGAYRLKKHAAQAFWEWMASWSVMMTKPSDLGYSDDGFILPPLNLHTHICETDLGVDRGNQLFRTPSLSSTGLHRERKITLSDRAEVIAELVTSHPGSWALWVETNAEADELRRLLPKASEVRGSDTIEAKERALARFSDGTDEWLISKASICGHGLNWQHCHRTGFIGLSYSFEQFYQGVRRFWRFGQEHEVDVHVAMAETEMPVFGTVQRKHDAHKSMVASMVATMARERALSKERGERRLKKVEHRTEEGKDWKLILGDCVEVARELPANCVDFSVYSPPFSNLYIYSDSDADMGNSGSDEEFFQHYSYLLGELRRITKPGRLSAVHCKDLPMYMGRDGAAGLKDFPGMIVRAMEEAGWTYHSRVTIWKCPVTEMQRTKNHGLLYKNLRKDSCGSRQGMADYVLVFRNWESPEEWVPVPHEREDFPLDQWQEWASPVWMDIHPMDVLNGKDAKAPEDERHLCPLQLQVIERCVTLWSNPGEVVFSPFAGIGSELFGALKLGRKALGIELKEGYFSSAIRNLRAIEAQGTQGTLLELMEGDDDA